MADGLTPRQAAFVHEYLIDLNATRAAIRAGYAEKTATQNASRLLGNVNIQKAIQEARKMMEKRTQITADRVILELGRIAFADVTDYSYIVDGKVVLRDSAELTKEQRSAIAYIKDGVAGPEIRLNDKLKALELLGKHFGMWEKQQEEKNGIEVVLGEAEEWAQ